MTEEWLAFLVTLIVVGIPVMGLTARFALKPIVESIVRLREAFLQDTLPADASAAEVEQLRREVHELREQVQRLTEATEFDRKLLSSDE